MIKKIALIIIALFMTGCTVQYNLDVNNEGINESVDMVVSKTTLTDDTYQKLINPVTNVYSGVEKYYDVKYKEKGSELYLNYTYNHKYSDYANSKILNWCYPRKEVNVVDNVLSIKTFGSFGCANRESRNSVTSADINITTKFKVLNNNADEVKKNTYTWHVTTKNYQNKPIQIEIKLPETYEVNEATQYTLMLIGGILVIGILIFIFIGLKKKKNNKL